MTILSAGLDILGVVVKELGGFLLFAFNVLKPLISALVFIGKVLYGAVIKPFELLRNTIVNVFTGSFDNIRRDFSEFVNFWIDRVNDIIRIYNRLPFVGDISEIGRVDFSSRSTTPPPTRNPFGNDYVNQRYGYNTGAPNVQVVVNQETYLNDQPLRDITREEMNEVTPISTEVSIMAKDKTTKTKLDDVIDAIKVAIAERVTKKVVLGNPELNIPEWVTLRFQTSDPLVIGGNPVYNVTISYNIKQTGNQTAVRLQRGLNSTLPTCSNNLFNIFVDPSTRVPLPHSASLTILPTTIQDNDDDDVIRYITEARLYVVLR